MPTFKNEFFPPYWHAESSAGKTAAGCKSRAFRLAGGVISTRPTASLFSAVLFSLCLLSARGADEAYSLRLRWIPGNTYTQETVTDTTTGLKAVGKADDQKMHIKQTTEVKVTESKAGEREARVTFKALSGEVMLNGKKHLFDSTNMKDADPMIKASVGQSLGKSFVLVYSDDYQFVEVRDTGAMSPSELGNPSLAGIAEAKEVADLYRRSLEMGLPKTQVKAGDRWTSQETVKFPSAGTVNVLLRARLELVLEYEGRRHAKIVFDGEMRRSDESAGSRAVTLGEGCKVAGQVLFDIDRGTVSASAFCADIRLEIQGKSIPVKQVVTTKLVNVEG